MEGTRACQCRYRGQRLVRDTGMLHSSIPLPADADQKKEKAQRPSRCAFQQTFRYLPTIFLTCPGGKNGPFMDCGTTSTPAALPSMANAYTWVGNPPG